MALEKNEPKVSMSEFLNKLREGDLRGFVGYRIALGEKYAQLLGPKDVEDQRNAWIYKELYEMDEIKEDDLKLLFHYGILIREMIEQSVANGYDPTHLNAFSNNLSEVSALMICVLAKKNIDEDLYHSLKDQAAHVESKEDFIALSNRLSSQEVRAKSVEQYDLREQIGLPRRSANEPEYMDTQTFKQFREEHALPLALAFLRVNHLLPLDKKIKFILLANDYLSEPQKKELIKVAINDLIHKDLSNDDRYKQLQDTFGLDKKIFLDNIHLFDKDEALFSQAAQAYHNVLEKDNSMPNKLKNKFANVQYKFDLDENEPREWREFCRQCANQHPGLDIDQRVKALNQGIQPDQDNVVGLKM